MIKNFFQSLFTWRVLAGIVIGGIAGYGYGSWVGCSTNTCPITSNPFNTALYFAFFGIILTYKQKKDEQNA